MLYFFICSVFRMISKVVVVISILGIRCTGSTSLQSANHIIDGKKKLGF